MQEADLGLTSMAMESGGNARYIGDEFLLVKFFTHPKLNQTKSAEEGRPIYSDQHYIQIMQPGNKDSIIQRPATEMDKNRFAEHYQKFLAREEQSDLEGTLLEDWPGVTRSQCEELKFLNVRTVEQLANISDSNAQNVMGIAFLKQKAANYLAASKDEATAIALQKANDEISELRKTVELLAADRDAVQDTAKTSTGDSASPAGEEKPKRRRRTAAKEE